MVAWPLIAMISFFKTASEHPMSFDLRGGPTDKPTQSCAFSTEMGNRGGGYLWERTTI